MAINFKRFFGAESVRLKTEIANKIRRGVTITGAPMRPKVIPNGLPLGFHLTQSGVPGRVRRAPVSVRNDGFTLMLGRNVKDLTFHTGRGPAGWSTRGQAPRPYAGFTQVYFDAMVDRLVKFIETEAAKDFKGRKNRF